MVLRAFFVRVVRCEAALDLLNRGLEFHRDSFQIGAFGMPPACELLAIVGNDARFWRLLDPTKRLRGGICLVVILGIGKSRELVQVLSEPRCFAWQIDEPVLNR